MSVGVTKFFIYIASHIVNEILICTVHTTIQTPRALAIETGDLADIENTRDTVDTENTYTRHCRH